MLPTTGYFKNYNCPFYDSCICERPYCHFKHSKRETVNDTNLISELVSKAVHKVLNSNLNSTSETQERTKDVETTNVTGSAGKNVTYNPTPIAELNKYKNNSAGENNSEKKNRHIPIQYTPERPRSSRSTAITNYNTNSTEDCTNTNVGYTPTQSTYSSSSSVSYVPSSIKLLSEKSTLTTGESPETHTQIECKSQPYVPSYVTSSDTSIFHSLSSYNPTAKTAVPPSTYNLNDTALPKFAEDFIDDFINDPNIYEPTESVPSIPNITETKIDKNKNVRDTSTNNKNSSEIIHNDSSSNKSSEKSSSDKHNKKSSSSKSKTKRSSSTTSTSSKSTHSKHSREKEKTSDKHKNGHDKKHKSHSSRDKLCSSNRKKKSDSNAKVKSDSASNNSSSTTKHKSSKSKGSKDRDKNSNDHKSNDEQESSKPKNINAANNQFKESLLLDVDVIEAADFSDYESDDSTMEQCKRIFEEYQPPKNNILAPKVNLKQLTEDNSIASTSKKRIAHENSVNVHRQKTMKVAPRTSAAQIMANRYKKVLANIEDKKRTEVDDISFLSTQNLPNLSEHFADCKKPVKRPISVPYTKTPNNIDATSSHDLTLSYQFPNKIKRIAHVPNVSSLLDAKKKVEEINKEKEKYKTPSQTITKGSRRVAHIPEVSITEMPTILNAEKSKLPVNVRNRYLFLMVKECVKLYVSKQAAYERALNEEFNCYSKCSVIATYRNSVMLSINRLRKEADAGQLSVTSAADANVSEFSGVRFYENLVRWILSEQELVENGYPRPGHLKKGYALFKQTKTMERIPENNELCIRCKKIFPVNEYGFALYPEDCIYHPGSRFVFRGETKYICCKESSASSGCCISATHVYEVRDPANLTGFVQTFDPERLDDPKSSRVYALDCEMVYTTRGFELARVTVINEKCEVVFETMVKPTGQILDCNTRFSGLTNELLENVSTRITEVQATLLLMFNSKTILMGHSLESDLKALRLIHSTVIDTSVLFPHKMGPPRKRGLKALASDFLRKIIQDSEAGHDSAEDAIVCMELVMWKLKEELKTR